MFPTLGLFSKLPCPEKQSCRRVNCLYTHDPDVVYQSPITIVVDVAPTPPSEQPPPSSSSQHAQKAFPSILPAKRSVSSPLHAVAGSSDASNQEPPRKLQRTGPLQKSIAVPTASHTSTGVPVLRVSAAQSQVPISVRQAMLKNLYDHFLVLYEKILPANPSLASEHALRQEEEVYNISTKYTYRNAVISSIATLKKRSFPDHFSHPSVGTECDVTKREEARKKMEALRLTASQLEPYVLSVDEMRRWGYIVDIPPGSGGERSSEEGSIKTCERCRQQFKVKRAEEADECVFHWGKPYSSKVNGERRRLYTCCSRSMDDEGCERGPHVFYDLTPEDLHLRHPFSFTPGTSPEQSDNSSTDSDMTADTALDIVALDCEMIYTTGGMRVARVSAVDSTGKEVFDEHVRMDEGVEVIDFNTRFSGITAESYKTALLPLSGIRASLDALVSSKTIVIGHGLDNDLKTLRMIHYRCVDTAIMFRHPSGPPFRRALRNLVKEFLGRTIQAGGGTVGHSSVEDSVATLDLVRWQVLNNPNPRPKVDTKPSETHNVGPS
ncbi:ribonuclease H-like protein [Sparassis latifolia]|uniref:RNA exonuclease 3 n=1 Tax=Sparassis crispa TaxID=139825 RepID=A0A401GC24_9APHY|nr:RNA exonuclease 3 [Sparassis crispa]GBE79712.1 RNA exonuclease 3 [Sparassis crispa]